VGARPNAHDCQGGGFGAEDVGVDMGTGSRLGVEDVGVGVSEGEGAVVGSGEGASAGRGGGVGVGVGAGTSRSSGSEEGAVVEGAHRLGTGASGGAQGVEYMDAGAGAGAGADLAESWGIRGVRNGG